jgi:diguanylate cyclase (GGDEF)-like protein/PAS domain S-box-containing protein
MTGTAPAPAARNGAAARSRLATVLPSLLAAAVVFPVLFAGRFFGFVADVPVWVLLLAFVIPAIAAYGTILLLPPGGSRAAMRVRVAVVSLTVGTIIYVIGWGAVLAIGLVFGVLEEFRHEGSSVMRPAIISVAAVTLLGEILVAVGVMPTLVPEPQGHGLALLECLGASLIIAFLSFAYGEKEVVESSLRNSEERLKALVQHASDAIVVIEPDGAVKYASPAVDRLLGFAPERLERFTRELMHDDHADLAEATLRDVLAEHGTVKWIELPLRHADGEYKWFEVGLTNLIEDASVQGIVCNMRDITERRSAQEELQFQAHHDALTRLPNRWYFLERLEQAQRVAHENASYVAVLFLDVDRFKIVNDSLGHEVGDRMLVSVSERLATCLRPGDIVARFGGDEFTVLLHDLAEPEIALRVADRIVAAMRDPLLIEGHELFVSASVGCALSRSGADRAGDLLQQADLAMYVAKEKGRARWELFDPSLAPHVMERLELEGDLWRALDHGELVVHFQPEVALKTGRVVATEALLRWNHPRRGLLEPPMFVPLAEESSLIVAIDRFVLREACRWARRWSDGRPSDQPLVVSVNLSPRYMRQGDVVADITSVLRETGVDPRVVQLEITERMALTDLDMSCSQLHQLRALGVRVAVDDFGTGYSSLSYLKQLPIDVLKLDKSFVDGLDGTAADLAIVQAIVTMGHALGVKITAEGVERTEQAVRLRELGCDSAMGWLWTAAVPPEQLGALAESGFMPDGGVRHGVVVPLRRAQA